MPCTAPLSGIYIGLMSGTSMDGVDAAIVEFGDRCCDVLAAQTTSYDPGLRAELLQASRNPEECTVDVIGRLDQWVAEAFADAAVGLLDSAGVDRNAVTAIGSHGQTLRHQPRAARPFTLQIGDPNVIAARTRLATVADFRRLDVALGGEGAPLAPAFHHWLFATDQHSRAVVNIGGFANVTFLPPDAGRVSGFDTGPGNTLMDAWCTEHRHQPFDSGGAWAASGTINSDLLELLLSDPYFSKPPPKSTGFEYFNPAWLRTQLRRLPAIAAQDVQATLCELTARTISLALRSAGEPPAEVLICGGGAHNTHLLERLQVNLPGPCIRSTAAFGLDPDHVEAAAFAWLAARRLQGQPGNLPAVTGAAAEAVLGAVYAIPL